jgi:glutamine synthetase
MASLYPETMKDAIPDDARIRQARGELEKAGVKYVFSCWIDIQGLPKTKPVPIEEFENLCIGKGPQFAVHSVSLVPELGPADPDQIPIPDLDSLLICPWNRELAFVFADLFFENAPYNMCPRLALRRQVKAAADAGYRFYAGVEPEFIVMAFNEDGEPVKAIDDDPPVGNRHRPVRQPFGYDVEYTLNSMPFLGELIQHLNALDWNVKNVVCEGGYSQFELDFGYTDVLGMADRMTFLRLLLKEVAKKHGMFATFMPKPTNGDWRSGAHINHSIQGVEEPGKNLFADGHGGWSDLAYNAVGGMLDHGAALTAVTCPTVNSYKGLIGRSSEFEGGTVTWAPTHMTYGTNNRSAMLRLPQARFAVENRACDMTMNFYLGLAMTTAATLDGIRKKRDPGEPLNTSLYDSDEDFLKRSGAKRLPANLLDALRAFDEDSLAVETLGETMHRQYSILKHREWDQFHEYISDWEFRQYLRLF